MMPSTAPTRDRLSGSIQSGMLSAHCAIGSPGAACMHTHRGTGLADQSHDAPAGAALTEPPQPVRTAARTSRAARRRIARGYAPGATTPDRSPPSVPRYQATARPRPAGSRRPPHPSTAPPDRARRSDRPRLGELDRRTHPTRRTGVLFVDSAFVRMLPNFEMPPSPFLSVDVRRGRGGQSGSRSSSWASSVSTFARTRFAALNSHASRRHRVRSSHVVSPT